MSGQLSPDLAAIVETWPTLPDAIKLAIPTLVGAVSGLGELGGIFPKVASSRS